MPELPEVETIRRDLERVVLHKRISQLTVHKPKVVRGSTRALAAALRGKTFHGIARRGKLLIFALPAKKYLLLHLKMTGQLIYRSRRTTIAGGHPWPPLRPAPAAGAGLRGAGSLSLPNKYTHVIFTFADNSQLFFNDLRQFGFLQLVSEEHKNMVVQTYGIEPLTPAFTFAEFRERLHARSTNLKNVLLNQAVIAGLGNIYVDEICFYARVRPSRRADKVMPQELQQLYRGCQHLMRNAIRHRGTTFRHFRDSHGRVGNYADRLKVYGRAGLPCRRCQTTLAHTTISGRGTVYCPTCQK